MNVKKFARYLLLVWLPFASLQIYNKTKRINRLENDEYSGRSWLKAEDKTDNSQESIKEMEKSSVKIGSTDLKMKSFLLNGGGSGGRGFENFFKKSSAKNKKKYNKKIDDKVNQSAHKMNRSVKKDLSALSVNRSAENRSAPNFNFYPVGKRKRRKRKNGSHNDRKREAVMEISVGEEANSLSGDYEEEEFDQSEQGNVTELGTYLGAPCELTCSEKLLHVFCDPRNRICECEEKYPVQIGIERGCEKPKQLGDQCFYEQTCSFLDPNAECTQINHNAICQCKPGFHTVALRKGVRRMFCSEDIVVVTADLPTLLGVATGIAVLTGLICFVLRLFSGNRYPNTRHYANANIPPPLLLSSDNQWINGIPLTVHGRPSSRSSCQRSTMSLVQYSRNKGVLVPASRAGAARAAAILLIPCHLQSSRHSDSEVINNSNNDDTDVQPNEVEQSSRLGSRRHSFSSVHSTTSSQKSMTYSARRFEQENQQREQRAIAVRAAKEEGTKVTVPPTPSPVSVDGYLPPSRNTEEDPLCLNTVESPAQSEPPALAISKGNIPTVSSKISPSK